MADMTITVDPDELLGLIAVAELGQVAKPDGGQDEPDGGQAETESKEADAESEAAPPGPPTRESTAKALMRAGLAAKLDELGLPWAPSPEAVQNRALELAQKDDTSQRRTLRRLANDARVRKYGTTILTVAALVVLWGGYIQHWQWTGFPANEQLWDWFHLLLLPVVFGTLPLWIQDAEYISRARRATYIVATVAFIGFVIVGYLAPLSWTGFSGNTLWDWFELIVLPVAVISVRAWPTAGRPVRAYHKATAAGLALAWVATLIGGYDANWRWTGYQGNTLWDWLSLLLLPLVFPTILLPTILKWISGNAEQRAKKAEEERKNAAASSVLSQANA
jgi:hypothetical protein